MLEVTQVTENQDNGTEPNNQERTFTQAELDAIVSDRLKRDRAKYADYEELKTKAQKFDEAEEQSKTELQKAMERAENLQAELDKVNKAAEIRSMRERISQETGVPVKLLTCETEDDCKEQAAAIMTFANPGYPSVKDGGEVHKTQTKTTQDQFVDWFNQAIN